MKRNILVSFFIILILSLSASEKEVFIGRLDYGEQPSVDITPIIRDSVKYKSISDGILGDCFGFNGDTGYGSNEPSMVFSMGVNNYRCAIQSDADWKIKQVDAACLHVIDYFNENEGHLLGYLLPYKGGSPGRYPFYDKDSFSEYLSYIRTMSERYNGRTKFVPIVEPERGPITFCIRDIALWNEPDLITYRGFNEDGSPKLKGRDKQYYGLTEEQTYQLIKPCVETIRSVHPTARIHTPAFAFFKHTQDYVEKLFDYEWYDYDKFGNVIRSYTIEDFCDIAEFHYYNSSNDAIDVIERINSLKDIIYKAAKKHNKWNIYNNPIWITETGTNIKNLNEERQARHTQKVYLYALSSGVGNIAYWGAFENKKKAWVDMSIDRVTGDGIYSFRKIWYAMQALFSRLNKGCTIPKIQIKDDICLVKWRTAENVPMLAIWSLIDERHIAIESMGDSKWYNFLGEETSIDKTDIKLTKSLYFVEGVEIFNYKILK